MENGKLKIENRKSEKSLFGIQILKGGEGGRFSAHSYIHNYGFSPLSLLIFIVIAHSYAHGYSHTHVHGLCLWLIPVFMLIARSYVRNLYIYICIVSLLKSKKGIRHDTDIVDYLKYLSCLLIINFNSVIEYRRE